MKTNKLLVPESLKKSDKIGLICPSGCVRDISTLTDGIKYLESLGFEVVVGESCYSKYGYLAGSDEVRASDVNNMFADSSIKGIFCARGGYGVHRILDKIDYEMIKKNPKFFCGYSDITGLHLAFNQICGFVTYHTPMASTELYKKQDELTISDFEKIVFDGVTKRELQNIPRDEKVKTLVSGESKGILVGGNLSLVVDLIGTAFEVDTKGKILFLEDVEEAPYAIDRKLMQLKLAGKFDECSGVILGGYTDCIADEGKPSLTLEEIFRDVLGDINKPVVYGFNCGHCMPTTSIPLGVEINLNATLGKIEIL